METSDFTNLAEEIKHFGISLGFQQVGITDTCLDQAEEHLSNWLKNDYHADMEYMAKHGTKRTRPNELIPGTVTIISVRLDYMPPEQDCEKILNNNQQAYVSRYALGRDYHKVLKKKLNKLAVWIQQRVGPFGYRAFVDSAPVMERAIANKTGQGWIGKNTCLINRNAGSYFFLGELYTDIPLPIDPPIETEHCGRCTACLDICPTKAIVAPYQLDARRCISYLTIENTGPIPLEFRKAIGNRIYGCDDCQLCCPWNRFAQPTKELDFLPRHRLDNITLIECFLWAAEQYDKITQGSAMRRCSYDNWIRNVAVALGNCQTTPEVVNALQSRRNYTNDMVREHIDWALNQHQ
ncbi:MAG: tRNA epoxyqueuosine(34) reductase QueG [Coxiellaceae bacterium]|nr:tRNA epoxyqueuosine(34) reductase QueG [Coxiellaceae bacterium]